MTLRLQDDCDRPNGNRRFTLLDGMIVIAALAIGFGLNRYLDLGFDWDFHSKIWMDPEFFFHSWMFPRFVGNIFKTLVMHALIATFATLVFRLRRPKPTSRRLVRQAGMSAILTVIVAWIASVPWLVLLFYGSPEPTANALFEMNLSIVVVLSGFGIVIRWGMLLFSHRWLIEPSWIDRLGRLVGLAWVVLGICAIGLRMVC